MTGLSTRPDGDAGAATAPLISIAMPAYNCRPFVDAAVTSMLRQTISDWELLIVDDGSTDDTLSRLERYDDPRIRVFSDGTNVGLPGRLNQLIDAARGTYIARMDADDVSYPDRLAKQIDFLRAHPDVDVVATGILVFDNTGAAVGLNRVRATTHEGITATPWAGFHFNHATWLGRAAWFRRFRYRPEVVRCEDDDLMLRSYRDSQFAMIPETLYGYRVDRLELGKILLARLNFCKVLLRAAHEQRDPRLPLGIVGQAGKAVIDTFSIVTGLNYRILRHRAGTLPPEEQARWGRVWKTVAGQDNGETG